MNENYLNSDGYPTDSVLGVIESWDPFEKDPHELMAFIKRLWNYAEWAWNEEEVQDDFVMGHFRPCIDYHISTAGWSGNEDLIGALKNNKHHFWAIHWKQSNRGGHYIIQIPIKK